MRSIRRMCGLGLLVALLGVAPAAAQDAHVLGPEELDALVVERADAAEADRAALRAFLERAEVQRIGGVAGIDLQRAESAVSVLKDEDAERLAVLARDLDETLAGGQDAVVISTTTLIIALLILVIILVA